ncbi:MAG: hypothetical protein IJP62_11035 [Treponema sp.]|nr:hypothetical protein [Treponema sp.]
MDFSGIDEGHGEGENAMVFRYNRAERISRAPKIVQDYYSGKMQLGRKGLFKSLVATKANRFLFFSVILCAGAVMLMWYFGPSKSDDVISAVPAKLTAFSFEDTVYVSLELSAPTKNYSQGNVVPVSADVQFFNVDGQMVQSERISTKYAGTQQFLRTTFADYDIIEVRAVLRIAEEEKELSVKVQHR